MPEVTGRIYERGKAPAPLPPIRSSLSNYKPYIPSLEKDSSDVTIKPKAIVVCDYIKKDNPEMSLSKSQIITVLESTKGSEWWKVQDSTGRQGFYPSQYLKII